MNAPRALRRFAAVALAALAAGCGSTSLFESGRIEYKSAGKLPPLEVPPDLTAPTRDDRYVVPDVSPTGTATYSAYTSERSGIRESSEILPKVENVRVERSGSQRWLVVSSTPEKVWPVVKEFWQETGFLLRVEQPEAGVMETDWAENRAKIPQDIIRNTLGRLIDGAYSTGERDKFRTRLEPGARPGTTEVYISHRGVVEVYTTQQKDSTVWQPRPPDAELEAEMLRRLMVRFGVEEARARSSVESAPPAERARLVSAKEGGSLLVVDEPFDRAWRRVGLALDRVGFTVEDRDRSKGFYFVRYVDPQDDAASGVKKSEGILSRLMFWRSSRSEAKPEQYRVLVRDNQDSSQVQVFDKEGAAEKSETARRILTLLQQQLK
ncbi:MAG: outer membrane protein assembly factor BamC [Burkholderiales bacterium]|nr:outer membrane protein assembly factor BamC [Burkholderiales bacterium]